MLEHDRAKAIVYRLPMRNWNQILGTLFLNCPQVYRLPMRNWNKLKGKKFIELYLVYRLPMRNWNLSIPLTSAMDIDSVYRLPMRNWNLLVLNLRSLEMYLFIDYLWGIETMPVVIKSYKTITVYRLPMRNWNRNSLESYNGVPLGL